MNWLDIAILCLAGAGLVKGLLDGAIKQVVAFIALIAGILFCGRAANWLKAVMDGWGLPEPGGIILSYILGFLLIVGMLVLVGEIMHRVIDVTPLSILNHLGGGLFGLLIMIVCLSLLFNILEIIDSRSTLISIESKVESRFYLFIQQIIPVIFPNGIFSIPK
ncbi:MAG: CvpA family protein [Tannerellaceae bacterium]|jgi:membrane protein required for colicin V production|nr:CvpA family protein [Tannerellaceae bacterium]